MEKGGEGGMGTAGRGGRKREDARVGEMKGLRGDVGGDEEGENEEEGVKGLLGRGEVGVVRRHRK